MLFLLATACLRPTDDYTVQLVGRGAELDNVLPAPEPFGGAIEYGRFRIWGHNIGLGITGLYGDSPRVDGTSFTLGSASFGYPPDESYDRTSAILMPGPPSPGSCVTRIGAPGWAGAAEYVDVGDHVAFSRGDGSRIVLERSPSIHPRPSGESWYASYGENLRPVVIDHELLPETWLSGESVELTFPGTIAPPESTLGSIPYPLQDADVMFPTALDGLQIDGEDVRPPEHDWYYAVDDPVRFAGPWSAPSTLTWEPAGEPLTVQLRLLGWGVEEDCLCSADCEAGFTCEDGGCVGDDGSQWNVLGSVTCTVEDTGEWTMTPEMLQSLKDNTRPFEVAGAVLVVARSSEGSVDVPDVLSWNGGRVPISPVRTRLVDLVATRVEVE